MSSRIGDGNVAQSLDVPDCHCIAGQIVAHKIGTLVARTHVSGMATAWPPSSSPLAGSAQTQPTTSVPILVSGISLSGNATRLFRPVNGFLL